MPFSKFSFKPGINTEITPYSNEGGWVDCDKIRFRLGFPEKIGGWTKTSANSFLGACRSLHPFISLSGDKYTGVGTNLKFYVETGASFNDITPIRATTSAGDVTFSAATGSSTLTVSHVNHGAVLNDFVTFSGAVSLGGNITADVLNQEYEIIEIVDTSSYKIQARTAGTSISSITEDGELNPTLVTATASDSGDGGSAVVGAYQINTGLDAAVTGSGWGASTWARGTWGSEASTTVVGAQLRLYEQDNFGEDLLFNVKDGNIYYWDNSGGIETRAVSLDSLSGASDTPTVARKIMVSDRDRHIIAFGCDAVGNTGVQDPLLIRFSDQASLTDWTPTLENTAGDLRLGSGSQIVTAIETRQQIMVFTDTTLYAMQFLGPPFTFGVQGISENISIASPKSAVAVDDAVYWMGEGEFYIFNGSVQRIPCTVKDSVFNNFNYSQSLKITAATNSSHSEIWWFYPSEGSETNDKYVVFNYQENSWYYGTLTRTAWMDHGIYEYPIAASTDGYLYNHENGFDDGSTSPPTAITSYVTSAPLDIGDGENFVFIKRLLPDVSFRNSTEPSPEVDINTRVRNKSSGSFLKETESAVTEDTEYVNLRLRGRQMSINVRSDRTGTAWRLGTLRYDLRPDGRQ
jgi:hypothetical protein